MKGNSVVRNCNGTPVQLMGPYYRRKSRLRETIECFIAGGVFLLALTLASKLAGWIAGR